MRFPLFCILPVFVVFSISQLSAQVATGGDQELRREIASLREAVIQQTRQIDALTTEVERLGVALGQRRPAAALPAPATLPPTAAPGTPVIPDTPPPAASTPEPTPTGPQHTVEKGENLTLIAKKYGTTADTIQKLNKITDVRKLQVGQVLSIPVESPIPATPAASPTKTP